MSTVPNIAITISVNPAGYNYVYVQFPEAMGSKFAIFSTESKAELEPITINTLLLYFNGIFIEECGRFSVVNIIGSEMLSFFGSRGVNVSSRIYNEDGSFIDPVKDFLLECIPVQIDTIYRVMSS